MDLVTIGRRAELYELTYRVALGAYHVYYCQPDSRRCSCAGNEPTDCRHLQRCNADEDTQELAQG